MVAWGSGNRRVTRSEESAMASDRLSVYPTWDLSRLTLPVRSALYPVAPVGVGTPDVESLTSYLARLARAHSVSVRVLLVEAIIPLVGRSDLSKATDNSLSAFWTTDSRALNGTGTIAQVWSQAVATLTGCTDLRHLTLLTWRDVLPTRELLRRSRAWCPACYEEWRRNGKVVYDPLRWALAVVTGCPRHRRRLRQACPHPNCRRSLPLLASRATPGQCAACGGWLGASVETSLAEEALSAEVLAWQSWVDAALGNLLAASPVATPPRRERVAHLIGRCVALTGSPTAFARALQLNLGTVCQWRQGIHLPTMSALVTLCYCLALSPRDFLLADPARLNPVPTNPHPPTGARDVPHTARKRFDSDRVRAALVDVLQRGEEPPPSMREVARRLGYSAADLLGRFPSLCRAISARYLAHCQCLGVQRMQRLCDEVREATFRVHAQGVYPSSVRVPKLLTHPSHFRHPAANVAWHAALRDLGWES
jgi:TniQ protein